MVWNEVIASVPQFSGTVYTHSSFRLGACVQQWILK